MLRHPVGDEVGLAGNRFLCHCAKIDRSDERFLDPVYAYSRSSVGTNSWRGTFAMAAITRRSIAGSPRSSRAMFTPFSIASARKRRICTNSGVS